MPSNQFIRLKKAMDRRIRQGHLWVYSNEIDVSKTKLSALNKGDEVTLLAHDDTPLGKAYVNPQSLIIARLFSKDCTKRLDQAYFEAQIKNALSFRESLFKAPNYRLLFSEGDFVPGLIIDRYGNDLVCQFNTAGMEVKIAEVTQALLTILPETTSILLRNDSAIRTQEGLERYVKPAFGTPPEQVLVIENGLSFHAPLAEGQKTGWFYDHRLNRARLNAYVAGRNVLDVFSYLGAFAIHAAAFSAKSVDAIETSEKACEFIRKNAKENQVDQQIKVINDDAFVAMKTLLKEKREYDLIVLDPPAFVKKAKDKTEGMLAYQRLNEMALRMLTDNGVLISCSCSMHVSEQDLLGIAKRAAFRAGVKIQLIEKGAQGPDHPVHVDIPETAYLKALWFRKSS